MPLPFEVLVGLPTRRTPAGMTCEEAIGLSRLQRTRLFRARAVPFGHQTRSVFKMNGLPAETRWGDGMMTSDFPDFSERFQIFLKTYRVVTG